MTIKNCMDCAFCRHPDIAVEPPDQEFADLACAPVRLLALEPDDQGLELLGQLIGVTDRPPGAIGQGFEPVFFVSIEDFAAGFAGDAEIPAHVRHRLTVQQAGDKAKAFFHDRTRFPRHRHLPPGKSEKCNPCVRYGMSPMSRAAQFSSVFDCTNRQQKQRFA